MLYFVHESTGEKVYLLAGKNYTVGVSSKDFPLKQNDKVDKSISRTHATIRVNFTKEESILPYERKSFPCITVACKDSSTYGTYINEGIETNKKVDKGSVMSLKPGDRVRFGLQWNKFSLEHEESVILVSTDLNHQNKEEDVIDTAWQLCAFVQREWNYDILPTFFCSDRLTICPELLCCLCKNIQTATPLFWKDCLKAVLKKESLPSHKSYAPSTAIPEINQMYMDKRQRLLTRKKFLFTNEDAYHKWKDVVECAGGTPSKWKCCTERVEAIARSDEYVVIGGLQEYEMDDETKWETKKNVAKLKELSVLYGSRKRFIPLKELALAILKCETDEFCNPNFKKANSEEILVADSIPSEPAQVKQEVVPETVESDFELEEESFISFRDQSALKRRAKSPIAAGGSLLSKVPRMEKREPSPCSSTYVPQKFTSTRAEVDTPPVTSSKPASRKRQRIESSSEDEDPFVNSKEEDEEEDIFGFANSSFSKKVKKVCPVEINTNRIVPNVQEPLVLAEDDDYNLEDKWTETSVVKKEPSEEFNVRVSKISLHSSLSFSGRPGSQKVFRKTTHSCMSRLPEIISFRDMKKVTCLTGKIKEAP
ncbi:nibrin-like isoform X1 [Cloeon dipterum]|uniref:nibrin-like isoform X1 n=1 Tax=Cloeon dipterum TaxID=197152 RepID=UPI0032207DC2